MDSKKYEDPNKPVKKGDKRFKKLFMPAPLDHEIEQYYQGKSHPARILNKIGGLGALRYLYIEDTEISQATDTRLNALMATPWRVEGENEDINDFVRSVIKPFEQKLRESFWWSIPYGYSVTQLIWKFEDNKYSLANVSQELFEKFVPTVDGRVFIQNVITGNKSEPELMEKFILTQRMPSKHNPYGEGLYTRLYNNSFFRCTLNELMIKYAERFALPFLLGKTPFEDYGKNSEVANSVQAMQIALDKARKAASLAVDSESDVTMLSSKGEHAFFSVYKEILNAEVQKLILGQTLTSEAKATGSFAQAKVHNEVREDKRRSDAKLVEQSFNKLIGHIMHLNMLPADMAPKYILQDDVGLETERAQRDATLSQQLKFSKSYYIDNYDLKDEDFELIENEGLFPAQSEELSINLATDKTARKDIRGLKEFEDTADEFPTFQKSALAAIENSKDKKQLIENLFTSIIEDDDTTIEDEMTKMFFYSGIKGYTDDKKGS